MPLRVGAPFPSLDGMTGWLPGEEEPKVASGQPLLVHFWAMSCPACHENMPHLQALRAQYGPEGLQVIAVHRPRGPFDLDGEKLRQVAADLGVTEPCALDNDHTVGDRFEVSAWPTYFLFDAELKLRRHAMGNFGVRMIEQALRRYYGECGGEKDTTSD